MGILVIILVMVSKYFWEVYKIFIVELDNDVCVNKVFVFFIFMFSFLFLIMFVFRDGYLIFILIIFLYLFRFDL